MLDPTNNTLTRTSNLPVKSFFENPSALTVGNKLYALAENNTVFKYYIILDLWVKVHKFN